MEWLGALFGLTEKSRKHHFYSDPEEKGRQRQTRVRGRAHESLRLVPGMSLRKTPTPLVVTVQLTGGMPPNADCPSDTQTTWESTVL